MIRYRHDPDRPDEPVIELDARDLMPFRSAMRRYLRRKWWVLSEADIEDVVQDSLYVACTIFARGERRGRYDAKPEKFVRAILIDITWRVGANHARIVQRHQARSRPLDEDLVDRIAGRTALPDAILDARRALEKVEKIADVYVLDALLRRLDGEPLADVAASLNLKKGSVHAAIKRARRLVEETLGRKPWSIPPRPPKQRKKKR